jgi:hypothetical protein
LLDPGPGLAVMHMCRVFCRLDTKVFNPADFESLEANVAESMALLEMEERYMKTLKNYVQNMARPKASMAEGYLKDECIGFITEYLQRFDAIQRQVWDAEEEYGDVEEVLEGVGKEYVMTLAV